MKFLLLILLAVTASAQVMVPPPALVSSKRAAASGGIDSPDDLPGLQRWFKSESIAGPPNGTATNQWVDSASGYDLTMATASRHPYVTNNIGNNQSGLFFDGTDVLTNLSPSGIGRNISSMAMVIIAMRNTGSSVNGQMTFVSNGTSSGSGRASFRLSAASGDTAQTTGRRLDADALFSSDSTTDLVENQTYCFSIVFDYSDSKSLIDTNNVRAVTDTTWGTDGNTSDTDSLAVSVGATAGLAQPYIGWIGEVIIYQPAPSTNDLQTLYTQYLKPKFGLP